MRAATLIVCDVGGAEAAVELFARADSGFAERATVILDAEGASADEIASLNERLKPAKVEATPNLGAAIAHLRQILGSATMGLRLYAAGIEPLIGSVVQAGGDHFIDPLLGSHGAPRLR